MSEPVVGLPPHISKIAGPLLIVHFLQWGLLGALAVQVYVYYLAFPKESFRMKILVYAVFAAEATQTILYSKMAFEEFVAGFGNLEALNAIGNFWFTIPILSSSVAFTVQIFYAYRIKLLARSNFIAVVVVLFALVQLGGAIVGGVFAHRISLFSQWVNKKATIVDGIWNAGSAICDILIAVSMTYYLSRWQTSWKPTQRMVQRLIFLIVGTGTFTATIAFISLILFLLPGHPAYYETASGILGKMYSNTMMVVLNSRIVLQTQDESAMLDERLPSSSSVSNQGVSGRSASGAFPSGISVTHEEWTVPLDVCKRHNDETKKLDADSCNVHGAFKLEYPVASKEHDQ